METRRYRDQILVANIYERRTTSRRDVGSSGSAFGIQRAACSEEKAERDWIPWKDEVSRRPVVRTRKNEMKILRRTCYKISIQQLHPRPFGNFLGKLIINRSETKKAMKTT